MLLHPYRPFGGASLASTSCQALLFLCADCDASQRLGREYFCLRKINTSAPGEAPQPLTPNRPVSNPGCFGGWGSFF